LSTYSESVNEEGLVPDALSRAAGRIAGDLGAAAPASGRSKLYFIPIAVGAASAIGAGITWSLAGSAYSQLHGTMNAPATFDAVATQQAGQSAALAAYVLTGLAVAGLVTGLILWLFGGPST